MLDDHYYLHALCLWVRGFISAFLDLCTLCFVFLHDF